ncbi:hypothetical protein O7627_09160 [Solwaraspora sp. WMMD1047]|uniref:hypothetical protein n=1 Tax=Solwaraspora sp. WMMD1047 TaxID=3016102 RepID=UPI002417594E|nr:hypothetical protein [Solwaraspora sp. WMMD1047]MDG4829469.1 hypothetical protein [Solwaraspora sp. WMMD1047]
MEQFNWTDAARRNLDGVTLVDVADVLYAPPDETSTRQLPGGGRIVMGRAGSGLHVAVLLVRNREISGLWNISFARPMTPSEVEEWNRWMK